MAKKDNSVTRQEYMEQFEAAILKLDSEEGFRNFCKAQSTKHKYSWRNTMLAAMQLGRPTGLLGGVKKYWNPLGRTVIPGQKALKIYAPIIVNAKDPEDPERTILVGWRFVNVFDISQTQGNPIESPEVHPTVGDSHSAEYARLTEWVQGHGWTVTEQTFTDSKLGFCQPDSKLIAISADVSPNEKLHVLAHEAAHAIGEIDYQRFTRSAAETIADTVAYLVCARVGLDVSPSSIGYVAGWSAGNVQLLKTFAETIFKLAEKIEGGTTA